MISEISYSSSIPLLYKITKRSNNYYYMFRNARTGDIIGGIEYPIDKYEIYADYIYAQIVFNDSRVKRMVYMHNGETIEVYDIHPEFKEEMKRLSKKSTRISETRWFRKTYELPNFKDDPELYNRIKESIKAGKFCQIELEGRYFRGLRDCETNEIITEFLMPIVKYTIMLHQSKHKYLDITIDDGVNVERLETRSICIYETLNNITKDDDYIEDNGYLPKLKESIYANDRYLSSSRRRINKISKNLGTKLQSAGALPIIFILLTIGGSISLSDVSVSTWIRNIGTVISILFISWPEIKG